MDIFKACPNCGYRWPTRDAFMADADLKLLGYQPNFVILSKGLFLFNHRCGTTVSVKVHHFSDLYQGPVFDDPLFGSSECLGYCLHRSELRPCPSECECSYVRYILDLLNNNQARKLSGLSETG